MNNKPSITVLLPVYNTLENELKRAIDSILNQTFDNFEFIIINDAATDNSEDVILSYKDDRIRYYKNETNLKLIATLNRGLSLSNGKYIARLDSDDYSAPTRLEKQFKFMEENQNIGVLGTFFHRIETNEDISLPTNPNDVKLCQRYVRGCISHPSVMIRKQVLSDNNLMYSPYCMHAEDYKLWCDLSYVTDLAVYPEVLTYISYHDTGVSKTNLKYQSKMLRTIILDNIIKDFAVDKAYMYAILEKYVSGAKITQKEFDYTKHLLNCVVDYLKKEISPPYDEWVVPHLSNLLLSFGSTFLHRGTKTIIKMDR